MTHPMRLCTKHFLLFVFLFLLCAAASAQTDGGGKQIQLRHANSLFGNVKKGYQRLIGAVEFEHQGMRMTCDSAHFYQAKNLIDAFGHVHIWQGDTINIWGDKLKYDGNTKKADLTGNVRL